MRKQINAIRESSASDLASASAIKQVSANVGDKDYGKLRPETKIGWYGTKPSKLSDGKLTECSWCNNSISVHVVKGDEGDSVILLPSDTVMYWKDFKPTKKAIEEANKIIQLGNSSKATAYVEKSGYYKQED